MLEDLNKAQRVLMIIVYVLTLISLLFGSYAIYNLLVKEKPWTLGVTYASTLDTVDGAMPIISVNIHSNESNNGESVYDFRINSYTDSNGNGVAGFGIQCVGDWKVIDNSSYKDFGYSTSLYSYMDMINSYQNQYGPRHVVNHTVAFGDFYFYYTGDNGEIFTKTSLSDIPNYMLIDIDGNFYRLLLKPYSCEVISDDFWAFLPWVPDTKVISTSFSWFEIFDVVMRSAINNNAKVKYEEFSLSLFDLSEFITIQYMDEKGQYHDMPKTTDVRNYFSIGVTYSQDGLIEAVDSMFGMVACSPTWSLYSDTDLDEYWNAYNEIYLATKHLNYIYDESKGGYIATIDEHFANYLSKLTYSEIRCYFDFCSAPYDDVCGIDLRNFCFDASIEIETGNSDFVVYNQSYCDEVPSVEVLL